VFDKTWLYDDREREAEQDEYNRWCDERRAEQDEYNRWCDERRAQHIARVELARTRRDRLATHTPLVDTVTDDTEGVIWHTGVREW
jgi:hypothetical protein